MDLYKRKHFFMKMLSLALCVILCLSLAGCSMAGQDSTSTKLKYISAQYAGFTDTQENLLENIVFTDNEQDLEEFENNLASNVETDSGENALEQADTANVNELKEEQVKKPASHHPASY